MNFLGICAGKRLGTSYEESKETSEKKKIRGRGESTSLIVRRKMKKWRRLEESG